MDFITCKNDPHTKASSNICIGFVVVYLPIVWVCIHRLSTKNWCARETTENWLYNRIAKQINYVKFGWISFWKCSFVLIELLVSKILVYRYCFVIRLLSCMCLCLCASMWPMINYRGIYIRCFRYIEIVYLETFSFCWMIDFSDANDWWTNEFYSKYTSLMCTHAHKTK